MMREEEVKVRVRRWGMKYVKGGGEDMEGEVGEGGKY